MSSQIGVEPGTADKNTVRKKTQALLLWPSAQPFLSHTYHPGAAACWSWAGFWPEPPHSLSHWCKETSWRGGAATLVSPQDPFTRAGVWIWRCVYSPFHLSEVHHVIDCAGLTHHVEPPQACVCVAGVEGLEAVAQVSLTGHLGQLTGQILESGHNPTGAVMRQRHRSRLSLLYWNILFAWQNKASLLEMYVQ